MHGPFMYAILSRIQLNVNELVSVLQ